MIPSYDHSLVWEGNSSMIGEIAQDIPSRPDAIVCAVGGGGMLGGLLYGCKAASWDDGKLKFRQIYGAAH
jgi:L-serine/L-threonine ammonia-lyase